MESHINCMVVVFGPIWKVGIMYFVSIETKTIKKGIIFLKDR